MIGPVILLTLASAMFAGLRLRWRVGQPATVVDQPIAAAPEPLTVQARIGRGLVTLLAVVAIVFGVTGSGLLLIAGVVALAGVVAMAMRRHRARTQTRASKRSAGTEPIVLADVLIIAGTLPAFALWWLIIPAILALLVVGGVIGTGPGTRRRPAEAV